MANIQITDPQALISQAEAVLQHAQNIMRVVESLSGCTAQIGNAWQSDTVDKESYLSAMNKSVEKMDALSGIMRTTGNKLIAYARQQIANANNSSQ